MKIMTYKFAPGISGKNSASETSYKQGTRKLSGEPIPGHIYDRLMREPPGGTEMLVSQSQTVISDSTKLLHSQMIRLLKLWEWSVGSHHCALET